MNFYGIYSILIVKYQIKVMRSSGAANYSDIAAGVMYAAQKGVKVINISLGGYANSNTLRNAVEAAVSTYGVVMVAGAGNDNLNQAFYPAAYDNVLGVAGTASTPMPIFARPRLRRSAGNLGQRPRMP